MTDPLGVSSESRHNSSSVEDPSPLDSSELRTIDACLSSGHLDEAQRLLAQVGDGSPAASSYLAVRLLYLRERLTPPAVAERLRELLAVTPVFPEAKALLELAAAGVPGRATLGYTNTSLQPAVGYGTASSAESSFSELTAFGGPGARGEINPDSERPTWVPDYSLPTAATQYPPAGSGGSLPPSRRIQVDTRDSSEGSSPAKGSGSPPARFSNSPPATAGRYAMTSQPPEAATDPTGQTSRPPAAPLPLVDPFSITNVSIRPGASQRFSREGRYSLTNAGSESLTPPRSLSRPERPLSKPLSSPTGRGPNSMSRPGPAPALAPGVPRQQQFRVPHPSQFPRPPGESSPFDQMLLQGDPLPAQRDFETNAETALARVETLGDAFAGWSEEGAKLLMTSPVTHYFGPFDRSLHSLARLDLALDTLYSAPYANPPLPLISVLGAYVGETLRAAHRGSWKVTSESLLQARVLAGGYVWEPFRLVHERLSLGATVSLYRTLAPALAREGTLAWLSSAPDSVPPPRLWSGPLNATTLTQLGTDLLDSVWSLACYQHFGSRLDGSVDSLRALDPLMDILARSGQELTLTNPWVMRLTALATGYVGEVLKRQAGGYWVASAGRAGEDPVVFRLGGGLEVTPMSNVLNRITTQKRFQLDSYVRVLLRRME
jgi:hypothetical protein